MLRARTAQAHVDLERVVDVEGALRSVDAYHRLLVGFAGFYRPMEAMIERAGLDRWDYGAVARRKSGWLEEDLVELEKRGVFRLRRLDCEAIPEVGNASRAFGCAYVLEGATLGGRQISKMLEGSDVPAEARRFFRSYGTRTGERWREFCESLEEFAADGGDVTEIVEGAEATFRAFGAWMRKGRASK